MDKAIMIENEKDIVWEENHSVLMAEQNAIGDEIYHKVY
jgi:hypothetical protein